MTQSGRTAVDPKHAIPVKRAIGQPTIYTTHSRVRILLLIVILVNVNPGGPERTIINRLPGHLGGSSSPGLF